MPQLLLPVRRLAGKTLRAVGLLPDWGTAGQERSSLYYDKAFKADQHFQTLYQKSPYYPTWTVVVDRLRSAGLKRVLDVGCGPGQFASMLDEYGLDAYRGLDFSPVAIQMAKQRSPHLDFRQADARDPAAYEGFDCDSVICMEVLEHIEDDLGVIERFPVGARCLMTVPNFPWRSHVRHFGDSQEVIDRYARWFDGLTVTRIKGVRGDANYFYLMDGVKRAAPE